MCIRDSLLVIEDERALCETIVRSLRRLAYSVDSVSYTHLDVYKRQAQISDLPRKANQIRSANPTTIPPKLIEAPPFFGAAAGGAHSSKKSIALQSEKSIGHKR